MKKHLLFLAAMLLPMALWAQEPAEYNVKITVPKGDKVSVGKPQTDVYLPLVEQTSAGSEQTEGGDVYYYKLTNASNYCLRVTATESTAEAFKGHVTYVEKFAISTSVKSFERDLTGNDDNGNKYLDIAGNDVPSYVNRDLKANGGVNVADIYVNGNYTGHVNLSKDDTFEIVALRTWQVTESQTGTFIVDPDYKYVVIDEDGKESSEVLTVDESGKATAVGAGTAIVLVSYDALKAPKQMGGSDIFGACWAENVGVMVFTVDGADTGIEPNIKIHEDVADNQNASNKVSTVNVDSELDVFYYVDTEDGYKYTFTPNNVTSVSIANPTVDKGANTVAYSGFAPVTANNDGSYTVTLKEGRNIVKMTNEKGSAYYVLKAKPVSVTITPQKNVYKAGDEVTIKFSTLYHPVNKLLRAYNFGAQLTYTDPQNLDAAVVGSKVNSFGDYYFQSTDSRSTLTVTLADVDADEYVLEDGCIMAGLKASFGDPFGNHRTISRETGFKQDSKQINAAFAALPVITLPYEPTYSEKTIAEEGDLVLDLADAVNTDDKTDVAYDASGVWTRVKDYNNPTFITSGEFVFAHTATYETYGESSWIAYSGYVPSTNGDNATLGYAGEFGVMAGGAVAMKDDYTAYVKADGTAVAANGEPYMVIYGNSNPNTINGSARVAVGNHTATPKGAYICMSPYTYGNVSVGDYYSQPFDEDGDYFTLVAVGLDKDGKETARATMKLAEYTASGMEAVTDWTWFDLSSLGEVGYIDFCFDGSDVGSFGLNTPVYFCLDKLVVTPTSSANIPTSVEDVYADAAQVVRVGNTLYNVPENSTVYVFDTAGRIVSKLADVEGEVILPVTVRNMIISVIYENGKQTLR